MIGQRSGYGGFEAHPVRNNRYLDAGVGREIRDREVVYYVSVEYKRFPVAYTRIENIGGVFLALIFVKRLSEPIVILLLSIQISVTSQFQRKSVFARIPAGTGAAVFFYQIRSFSERRMFMSRNRLKREMYFDLSRA